MSDNNYLIDLDLLIKDAVNKHFCIQPNQFKYKDPYSSRTKSGTIEQLKTKPDPVADFIKALEWNIYNYAFHLDASKVYLGERTENGFTYYVVVGLCHKICGSNSDDWKNDDGQFLINYDENGLGCVGFIDEKQEHLIENGEFSDQYGNKNWKFKLIFDGSILFEDFDELITTIKNINYKVSAWENGIEELGFFLPNTNRIWKINTKNILNNPQWAKYFSSKQEMKRLESELNVKGNYSF